MYTHYRLPSTVWPRARSVCRSISFFVYSLIACDLATSRSWRYAHRPFPVHSPRRRRLVVGSPLPSARACPRSDRAHQGNRKRDYKGKHKGKPPRIPLLSRERHDGGHRERKRLFLTPRHQAHLSPPSSPVPAPGVPTLTPRSVRLSWGRPISLERGVSVELEKVWRVIIYDQWKLGGPNREAYQGNM